MNTFAGLVCAAAGTCARAVRGLVSLVSKQPAPKAHNGHLLLEESILSRIILLVAAARWTPTLIDWNGTETSATTICTCLSTASARFRLFECRLINHSNCSADKRVLSGVIGSNAWRTFRSRDIRPPTC